VTKMKARNDIQLASKNSNNLLRKDFNILAPVSEHKDDIFLDEAVEEFEWNINCRFNVNPKRLLQFGYSKWKKRTLITDVKNSSLRMLLGLPILSLNEIDVSQYKPVNFIPLLQKMELPVSAKFGFKLLEENLIFLPNSTEGEPADSRYKRLYLDSPDEPVAFLGKTSTVEFKDNLLYNLDIERGYDSRPRADDVLTLEGVNMGNEDMQPIRLSAHAHNRDKSRWSDNCKARANIIKELVTTEETYLETLKELNDQFLSSYTEKLKLKQLIDLTDFRQDVNTLISLHGTLLEKFRSEDSICDVFLGEIAFLKMYKNVIHNYVEVDRVMKDSISKKSIKFKKLFEKSENERLRADPIGYFQYLAITIVQRTPRYKLMLSDLKKHTPPEHPEYDNLVKGLNQIVEICSIINEYQRRKENEHQLLQLQMKIDRRSLAAHKIPNLVIPSRRLIRFGQVAIKNVSNSILGIRSLSGSLSLQTAEVLMCSDKLIITCGRRNRVRKVFEMDTLQAEVKKEAIQCEVNEIFELELSKSFEMPGGNPTLNKISSSVLLKLDDSPHSMCIYLSTLKEAEEWANDIKRYSKESRNAVKYVK